MRLKFSYRKISVSCPTPLSGRKSRVLHVVKCTQMFLEKEDSLGVPETGSPQSRGECCKSHNSRTQTSSQDSQRKQACVTTIYPLITLFCVNMFSCLFTRLLLLMTEYKRVSSPAIRGQ